MIGSRDTDRITVPTIGIDASRGFGAEPTGTERYAAEVIRRVVNSGAFECRLYLRGQSVSAVPSGAETVTIGARRLWTHLGLARELALRPPDTLFVPAHVVPLYCRPPAVVTVHDLGYVAFPGAHPRLRRAYLDWSTRRHASLAEHVIADSQATKDDLVRHYGADPRRITVALLGVDDEMLPADSAAIDSVVSRYGLDPTRRYVLHVGTMQPRKNLSRLVDAFAQVSREHSDVELVLAGQPGWGDVDLSQEAALRGLAHRVRVLGYVSRADLPALYSGASAVVVPSLYEGFGLSALEGMACGAAVAVSRTSSLPEVVGDSGLLFDPLDVSSIAEAVSRLLSDDALVQRLAQSGIERARSFTWDRCAERVCAVLYDVGCRSVGGVS